MMSLTVNEDINNLGCGSSTHQILTDTSAPSCTSEASNCNRSYHLYIPSGLCDSNSKLMPASTIGSIPLVFGVHCFGCNADSMKTFEQMAQIYNFILVRPEGLHMSWNAKYCCGYALEQKLDDMGFFSNIIHELEDSLDVVSKEMVYGLGWSNGGYMVTYAANLFRAVAPIAGYQYGGFEELNPSIGLFQHHSMNDPVVSIHGCCTDSKCCCGISDAGGGQCMSVNQEFEIWAETVNQCDKAPSLVTFKDDDRGIECRTRSGHGCSSNTTLCVYEHESHFKMNNFPMQNEIGDFFARDACLMNGGSWSSVQRRCLCEEIASRSRIYCSTLYNNESPYTSTSVSTSAALGSMLDNDDPVESNLPQTVFIMSAVIILAAVAALLIKNYWNRGLTATALRKKGDGWERVNTEESSDYYKNDDGVELQVQRNNINSL